MEPRSSEPRKNLPAPQNLPALAHSPVVVRPRTPAMATDGEEGLSPQRILAAVRYWWKWALPAGLALGCAAAAVVYTSFTPQYEAVFWLRIEEQPTYLAFEAKDGADQSKGFVQTQIELLRSPMVLGPVVAEREMSLLPEAVAQQDLIAWLAKKLSIKAVGSSELYTVSFSGSNPQAAAHVVNAVVDSYFNLRRAEQGQRIKRVIDVLDLEKRVRTEEVEAKRNEVRELAQQITGRDPFQTAPQTAEPETKAIADLAARLVSLEVEESVLRAQLQALETIDPAAQAPIPDAIVEQAIAANPQVQKRAEAIAQMKSQLSQFLAVAARGKDDPTYQRASQRVADEEKALDELERALREQAQKHLQAERSGKLEEQLTKLRTDLDNRQVTRQVLQERYESELKNTRQSTGDTVLLRFKQEELARAEKVLDLISERIVQLTTEQGAPNRVWEDRRATVPVTPVQNLPYTNMLLGFVVGLCAPFGLAVLKEQITARVNDVATLERRAHLAVLGEITRLPTKERVKGRLGPREQLARHLFEESIDSLRTNLLLAAEGAALRFLAVTSAVNQEGKTSVSVQLAASIARATRARTLVIDGDLRDPSVHTVFEVPREPGLTEVLSGTARLEDTIAVTRVEGVDVLPAGMLRGNPHPLFANGRWEHLLQQISAEYRYVIIDTPPVLAASEALVLARGADAVLMCALRDVTRLPQLQKATDRVVATGAKVAGLILNGIPASHYASRYGTYSYLSG